MTAPKKMTPFSRLRGFRSRKNGSSSRRASNPRKTFKSSVESESSRAAACKCASFPPYFTVDDLAALRRKRVPPKYRDTLRPLAGRFADACSEYRSAYRSFVVAADDSIMNWKKKKMKTLDCVAAPEEPQLAPEEPQLAPDGSQLEPDESQLLAEAPEKQLRCRVEQPTVEQYIRHAKTRAIRPTDTLRKCAGGDDNAVSCNTSSETKDKYVVTTHVKPALLMRQATHLKMEGEFDAASETKEKYVGHSGAVRAQLMRRITQLHPEGGMELISENASSFVPFGNAQRARLLRRHSTFELPTTSDGGAVSDSEYHQAFRYPERYERARLIRSLENLCVEGEMQFEPEYARSFVDFHIAYPCIKYRERRRSLVESHHLQQQQCELKTALTDSASTPCYSPEYRHSYVRFPVHRPTLQRPHTNLEPPHGIGDTESELKAQLRKVWLPKSSATAPSPLTTGSKTEGSSRVCDDGNGVSRPRSRGPEQQQSQGNENWREKPFYVLAANSKEPVAARKHVNFTEDVTNRPLECAFRKGERLPVTKSSSEAPRHSDVVNSEMKDSRRPTFRLEVTNPDHKQKPFEKQRSTNTPFVVLDENNNTNLWIRNKQNRKRWTPSWMKV